MQTKPLYRSERESFNKDIYMPVSNLITAPVVSVFADKDFFNIIALDKPPQRVFFNLDRNLNAITEDGKIIGSLLDCLKPLCRSVPVFYIKDKETADALAVFTDENNIADASLCVEFDNRDVLKYAYKLMPLFKCMIDYRNYELPADAANLAGELVSHFATSIILKSSIAVKSNVRKLQRRFIHVTSDDGLGVFNAIHSGINGVITKNPSSFYNAYELLPENTIAKNMNLIAHKGFQNNGMYSENTISGITAAGVHGFDGAEIDVKLTTDDIPIVMHNLTTKGVFHGEERNIEKSTYAELADYRRVGYEDEGIDTFADLMVKMKEYPETPIVIELKPLESNYNLEEMVRQVKATLEREDVQKNCTAIMGKLQPDLGFVRRKLDFLSAAQCDCEKNPVLPQTREVAENVIYKIINITKGNSCGYNPEDTMTNRMLAEYIKFRGITLFPWSRSWFFAPSKWEENGKKCDTTFLSGCDGWTTDHGEMYLDYPIDLTVCEYIPQINTGDKIDICGKNLFRNGITKKAENAKILITNGDVNCDEKGNLFAIGKGEIEGILLQKINLHFGDFYHIVSDSFKISVV